MLAQVVVHDEHVVPLVHEVLGQGAPGVGGDILQGGGRPRGGGDDGGVFHSPPAGQIFRQLGHRAGLLADGYIDAHHVLALLVEDGVQGDGGLAGLAVADDQLPLAPADGEHGVDGQKPRLHGGVHRLALQDARGGGLHGAVALRLNGPFAVQRQAQGVHHPAQVALPHRHTGGFQGAADHAARPDLLAVAEEDAAQPLGAQVLHHALHAALEHQDLPVLGVGQPAYGGDIAVHRQHLAHLLRRGGGLPPLHRLAHEGNDVVMSRLQPAQVVLELPHPSVQGPVVHVRAHLEAEAVLEGLVIIPVEGHLPLVGAGEELLKSLELFLGGLVGAAQKGGEAASSVPHAPRLPPSGPGTGQRNPRRAWRPAFSPPGRPAPAAPAGTPAAPAPWTAPPRPGP